MNYWGEKAQLSLTMIKGAMSVTFSNVLLGCFVPLGTKHLKEGSGSLSGREKF